MYKQNLYPTSLLRAISARLSASSAPAWWQMEGVAPSIHYMFWWIQHRKKSKFAREPENQPLKKKMALGNLLMFYAKLCR